MKYLEGCKMCECDKRIDELKTMFKDFIYQMHDVIVDVIDDQPEGWFDIFDEEMDVIYNKVEAI